MDGRNNFRLGTVSTFAFLLNHMYMTDLELFGLVGRGNNSSGSSSKSSSNEQRARLRAKRRQQKGERSGVRRTGFVNDRKNSTVRGGRKEGGGKRGKKIYFRLRRE